MFAPSVDGAFGYALRHLKILGHRENKKSDHVVSRHEIRQTYESHSPAMLAVHIRPSSDAGSRMQYMVFTVSAALSGSAVFTPYGYAIPAMMANLSYGR